MGEGRVRGVVKNHIVIAEQILFIIRGVCLNQHLPDIAFQCSNTLLSGIVIAIVLPLHVEKLLILILPFYSHIL